MTRRRFLGLVAVVVIGCDVVPPRPKPPIAPPKPPPPRPPPPNGEPKPVPPVGDVATLRINGRCVVEVGAIDFSEMPGTWKVTTGSITWARSS